MTIITPVSRRVFAATAAISTVATLSARAAEKEDKGEDKYAKETGATEDLMREHGVLRRCLLVYSAASSRLRQSPGAVPPDALSHVAALFRDFGENYHEKLLEEQHIFPVVRKTKGEAAAYPDILIAQHNRGREITQYILDVSGKGSSGTGDAEPLARALDAFVLMYRHHAAREDTVIFTAWKRALSGHAIIEMGDQFEDIEKRMFGHDGFEDAVKKVTAIEQALGLGDLAQFTAPSPPRPS
jgi:hemerythrin-like domain-containing protein